MRLIDTKNDTKNKEMTLRMLKKFGKPEKKP